MNKVQKVFLSSTLLFLAGCSGPQINYIARVKLQTLNETDIYNSDRVIDVLFDAEELNSDSLRIKSRHLFLQGIDYFKNKKNASKAIALFKSSILVLPEAKAYYELGNALMEASKPREALDAYDVAERLNFTPTSLIYYKNACAFSNLPEPNYEMAGYEMKHAFDKGFRDTAMLYQDEKLRSFVLSNVYQSTLRNLFAQTFNEEPNGLFNLFKSSFPTSNGSFEITPEQVNMSDYKQSISYDFVQFVPEMESSSFGRSVSNDFIFVSKLHETPFYTAVIYSSVVYFGDGLQPVYTKLVTYDPEGKIIAAKLFSGQFSAERVKAGRFEDGKIIIKDYKRIWEQPIDKVPFDQNSIKNFELQATATFRIDDAGRIENESVPEKFKDSIILVKK